MIQDLAPRNFGDGIVDFAATADIDSCNKAMSHLTCTQEDDYQYKSSWQYNLAPYFIQNSVLVRGSPERRQYMQTMVHVLFLTWLDYKIWCSFVDW